MTPDAAEAWPSASSVTTTAHHALDASPDMLTAVTIPAPDPPLPQPEPDERWGSVELTAKLFGLSTPTVRRRIKAGGPPFTLPDGSDWPVESEQIVRPQGTYFMVKLPARLEVPTPSVETSSTEDLTIPDRLSDDEQASPPPVMPAEDASSPAADPSPGLGDASLALVRELVADLGATRELVGELRISLDRTLLDLDASRRETDAVRSDLTHVRATLEASLAERDATLHEQGMTLQSERERRLVTEAALLALSAREDALTAREQAVAATEARVAAMGLWARLRWLLGV